MPAATDVALTQHEQAMLDGEHGAATAMCMRVAVGVARAKGAQRLLEIDGESVCGKVVAMPSGRGSSSSTAVLAHLIRSGHGPAGILLAECEAIVVIGAPVAAEMYSVSLPIVGLAPAQLAALTHGATVDVLARTAPLDATVRLQNP